MSSQLPNWLIELCRDISSTGGKAFLVGGCVRDRLLGYPVKDYDIEVYGLPSEQLREVLEKHGRVNTVGEHFAVYKLKPNAEPAYEVDVSLPRRESKQGSGHRGFIIQGDPWMTFHEAANRRDFTINAILQDPLSGSLIDPCQGLTDLNRRELRAVNANTFKDDSLRVLRAAQLSSRYKLKITDETKFLCRETSLKDIPKERIWDEVRKLLLLSPHPSLGFGYFLELGVIGQLFPMLWELQSSLIEESPYPEEPAWNYVLNSLDRSKLYIEDLHEPEKVAVLMSVIGTRLKPDSLTGFLDALGIYTYRGYHLRTQIIILSKLHLMLYKVFYQSLEKKFAIFALRRITRLTDLRLITSLWKALCLGDSDQISSWLEQNLDSVNQLGKPILGGYHILDMGIASGPEVGRLIQQIYEYQIEEKIKGVEEAKKLAKDLFLRKAKLAMKESFKKTGREIS